MSIVGNIEVTGDKYRDNIMKIFTEVGGTIEGRAVEYAPADLGDLRGSSFVKRFDEENTVVIGFAAEYAAAVHDMIPKHAGEKRKGKGKKGCYWDVGKPNFLKDAFDEILPALMEELKHVSC